MFIFINFVVINQFSVVSLFPYSVKLFSRTKKAMSGKMSFRESLRTRLNMIDPSVSQIQEFIRSKPPTFSDHVKLVHYFY